MYRSIIALLLIFVAGNAALTITYLNGNLSVSEITTNGLTFRDTTIGTHGFGNIEETQFISTSVSITNSSGSASISSSAVVGFVAVIPYEYPVTFLSSWAGTASWQLGSKMFGASLNGVAGLISAGYLNLVERDSGGNVIANISLLNNPLHFFWTSSSSGGETPDGNLMWSSIVGRPVSLTESWTITLTSVASNVVGYISYANALVGPKSLETVVSIQNYPYASNTNTLSLTMAVATAGLSASYGGGQTGFTAGNGAAQMWFSLSNAYYANGAQAPAAVQIFPLGNRSVQLSPEWQNIISDFSVAAGVELVEVTFGAGVASIVYDPAVGSGAQMSHLQNTNAGSFTSPALMLSALLLLSALL